MLKKRLVFFILLSFLIASLPGMALGETVTTPAAINADQVTIAGQTDPGERVSLCVEREDGKISYIHQLCANENGDFQFMFSLNSGEYYATVSVNGENLEIPGIGIEVISGGDHDNDEDKSPEVYSASISVKGDTEKGWILPDSNWIWTGSCTVMKALTEVLDQYGIDYNITYGGSYVQSIDGLAHKKEGFPNSGWVYKINGEIGGPANAEKVEDGDYVYWYYSLDYTQESNIDDLSIKQPELKKPPEETVPGSEQSGKRISFDDVGDDIAWARDAIELLAGRGIIKGSGQCYEPHRSISRAEMLALLVRINELENREPITDFKDVKDTDWFFDSVILAVAHGWISGYEDGTIQPNMPISRNELACLLARAAGPGKKPDMTGEFSFSDEKQIPSWAWQSVKYAVAEGWLSGYPDGSFRGEAYLSRAEAAVVIYNYLQKIESGEGALLDANQ